MHVHMEVPIMHICESNCALLNIIHTNSLFYLVPVCSNSQQFLARLDVSVVHSTTVSFLKLFFCILFAGKKSNGQFLGLIVMSH
jgi:hypothetical protein